jgi:hypothetical protein
MVREFRWNSRPQDVRGGAVEERRLTRIGEWFREVEGGTE